MIYGPALWRLMPRRAASGVLWGCAAVSILVSLPWTAAQGVFEHGLTPQTRSNHEQDLLNMNNTTGVTGVVVTCPSGTYVPSPDGCVPKQCAFGSVATVDIATRAIESSSGKAIAIPASCLLGGPTITRQIFYSNGTSSSSTIPLRTSFNSSRGPPPTTNGWVEDAYYSACGGLLGCGKLTANEAWWTVPDDPSLEESQTIYLFIALEDQSGSEIVQPVLEWGPSCASPSGSFWSIASYYVYGSTCAESDNTAAGEVEPGDTLSAYVACFSTCDSNTFQIGIGDHTNGAEEFLTVSTATMTYAYVTLEAYNVDTCTEYPATGATEFYYEYVAGGSPGWQAQYPNSVCPDDDVVADGGTPVYLYY